MKKPKRPHWLEDELFDIEPTIPIKSDAKKIDEIIRLLQGRGNIIFKDDIRKILELD